MKSIPNSLREHLDGEVTALCTCWTIERVDGKVLRFTDADEDVTQGGDTYKAIGAYKRTAIETTSTLSVDNLEIVGAANDLSLPEEELRAGLFDNAQVTIFMTPWLEAVKGRLRLRRGFFGEVKTIPNNTYQVELRGVMQRLGYNYMDIFSSSCLYDLGERRCGVNISGPDLAVGQVFEAGDVARVAQNSFAVGKAYDIGWVDPDFELAGIQGLNQSTAWYNSGVNDLQIVSDQKFTGAFSARGGNGAGTLTQDVDLEADTELPVDDLDSGNCFLTMRAFRRDVSDEGRFSISFLDRDGIELGFGRALTVGSGYSPAPISFSGDFTIELWLNMSGAVDTNQTVFGAGAISNSPGDTGNRLSFEGGKLTFRVDDDVLFGDAQKIVESPNTSPAGEWIHVALTRSGSTLSLYENFDLVDSAVFTGPVEIDRWADGPNVTSFTGLWDELRVWSVAKEGFELAIDGRRTISPASAGLFRYYSFDDTVGADLTGNDLSFTFGVGVSGNTSPIAVAAVHAIADGSATLSTGYQNVGSAWVEQGFMDRRIPPRARTMRVNFDVRALGANPVNSYIDNLTGHIINTGEPGRVLGYMTNNVSWRCLSPGVGNTDRANGGVGSTISSVGVILEGENAFLRAGRVISSSDARTFIAEVEDPRAVDAWFNEGAVIFETGANAGVTMEVKNWNAATREVELVLSVPSNIKAGDYFSIYPGCDKSRISCAAIFRNIENMFASPDIPGQDELYRYPDAR